MAIPSIRHNDGRMLRFGRLRPSVRRSALHLKNYLSAEYAPPPSSRNWTNPTVNIVLQLMYLNDQLGDCVIAWGGHREGLWTGDASGLAISYSDNLIINEYSAIGGYVPGDASTDQGINEDDANDYWVQHGFANGIRHAGWLRVDATKPDQVKGAINEFGSCTTGMELPDEWVKNLGSINSGTVWDVAGDPNPKYGHCTGLVGFDGRGLYTVSSWGMLFGMTEAAVAKYCSTPGQGELTTAVSQRWVDQPSGMAPNGLAWSRLTADMVALQA